MKDIKYKNGLYTLGFTSYKGTSATLGNYEMFTYQTKYVQCNITIYEEQEIRMDSLVINIDLDAIIYDLKLSNAGEDSYQFAWKQLEKIDTLTIDQIAKLITVYESTAYQIFAALQKGQALVTRGDYYAE